MSETSASQAKLSIYALHFLRAKDANDKGVYATNDRTASPGVRNLPCFRNVKHMDVQVTGLRNIPVDSRVSLIVVVIIIDHLLYTLTCVAFVSMRSPS